MLAILNLMRFNPLAALDTARQQDHDNPLNFETFDDENGMRYVVGDSGRHMNIYSLHRNHHRLGPFDITLDRFRHFRHRSSINNAVVSAPTEVCS